MAHVKTPRCCLLHPAGVLLLVDSVEGPMPQTRFVLRKALHLEKKVVVVVNKIDRPSARPDWVVDHTFELFMDLGATDEQCDFPIVYASGVNGIAGMTPETMAADLGPLFDTIIKEVRPRARLEALRPAGRGCVARQGGVASTPSTA